MTFLHSIILGIVEGITEFLPISSTGHLILASQVLGISQTDFVKSFEIAIQLGAILSVVVLYWRSLILNKKIFMRVATAFIPTAVIGLVLYSFIKKYLIGNSLVVVISLFVGGIGLILFEKWYAAKGKTSESGMENITLNQALVVGVFQSLAVIPGISRAAATIVGGLFLGIERKTIVEFSFLLAVPTMLAATGLDLIKSAYAFTAPEFVLLAAGFFVSFIVAIVAIKFLLNFIEKNTFVGFGWYRIAVSLIFAVAFLL